MYQDFTHAQAVPLARVDVSHFEAAGSHVRSTEPAMPSRGLYLMAERVQPSDLELAALISSKICHDLIGPVGNINNGLEILDEEEDAQSRNYALDVIRNVTETASARLQFARFAYGATDRPAPRSTSPPAEELSRGLIGTGKHKLVWRGLKGQIAKDKAKLLLNLVAAAPNAVPRGGEIVVELVGTLACPELRHPLPRPQRPAAPVPDRVRQRPGPGDHGAEYPGLLHGAVGHGLAHAAGHRQGWGRCGADGEGVGVGFKATTVVAEDRRFWHSTARDAPFAG